MFKRSKMKDAVAQSQKEDLRNWFTDRLEEVGVIQGADHKLFKLGEIKSEVDDKLVEARKEVSKRGSKGSKAVQTGVVAAQVGAVAGAAVLTHGLILPFWLLIMFGGSRGSSLGKKTRAKLQKRFAKKTANITEELEFQSSTIEAVKNKLVKDNFDVIAQSPIRDLILVRFPDMRGQFEKAAVAADNEAVDAVGVNMRSLAGSKKPKEDNKPGI